MTSSIDRYRRSMTESEMEIAIRDIVERKGGRVFHIKDSRRAPETADMPDLLVICPPFVGVLELKSQNRKITPGQIGVIELLAECSDLLTGVVRPVPKTDAETSFDELIYLLGKDWLEA